MKDLRVGLIGYGAVGRRVAELVADGAAGDARIVGVLVRSERPAAPGLGETAPFVRTAAELIALGPMLVVEAAGHDALRTYVPEILEAGIEVLAISVGVFADDATLEMVRAAAERGGSRLRVPSGAIAALDAVSAAAIGRIERAVHTVRKPPASLMPPDEAAAVIASGLERELFFGPAREAALRFPANVNVVAAVSLAGIGLDRTQARVVADPRVVRNTHEVELEGEFGRLSVKIENIPSENPKTGRIVAMSIVRALRAYGESVVVGA